MRWAFQTHRLLYSSRSVGSWHPIVRSADHTTRLRLAFSRAMQFPYQAVYCSPLRDGRSCQKSIQACGQQVSMEIMAGNHGWKSATSGRAEKNNNISIEGRLWGANRKEAEKLWYLDSRATVLKVEINKLEINLIFFPFSVLSGFAQ